eukprot:TRINITY_DN10536_c0_g1_i1.p1 TRINITY_DN10536_c0_g1~~TRINITY_DN10536_c0_g1_i1.p1  ORF type:complete len:550 (+),score=110.75 TRINITY_DN10536_c0_g1_i1:42-1691(+)
MFGFGRNSTSALEQENERLRQRVEALEHELAASKATPQPKEQMVTGSDEKGRKRPKALVVETPQLELPEPTEPTVATEPEAANFSISPAMLVVDKSGPHQEPLVDVVQRMDGEPQSPFLGVREDPTKMCSFTTARDIFSLGNGAMPSPPKASNPLLPNVTTAIAQQVVNLLNSQWREKQDPTFPGLDSQVELYGKLLTQLCSKAARLLRQEPLLLSLRSPIYVMGDIHGSFGDLDYFLSNLINFGSMQYTSNSMLFLGDYVDRGIASVEVAAMLLALKCLAPNSVYLLRGNHETVDVNTSRIYGATSFLAQCCLRFGTKEGHKIASCFNGVFAQMAMAAEIDKRVFCVHGGITKPHPGFSFVDDLNLLRDRSFPRLESWQMAPEETPAETRNRDIALGLLWSDPASSTARLDNGGFGTNPRGGDAHTFGRPAVLAFMANTGYQYIIRAHEMKQKGIRLAQNGQLITVFTSSGYCGGNNGAGAVFISEGALKIISVLHEDDEDYQPPQVLSVGHEMPTRGPSSPIPIQPSLNWGDDDDDEWGATVFGAAP